MNYYVPLISQRYRNFLVNSHFSLYLQSQTFGKLLTIGELAEWLMAAVLKTVDLNGFGGSNPSLSARNADFQQITSFSHNLTHTNAKVVRIFYCILPNFIIGNYECAETNNPPQTLTSTEGFLWRRNMILFHGSNMPVETIDLALSKPNKDFGRAFYLSTF